jgi:hypothetical protein
MVQSKAKSGCRKRAHKGSCLILKCELTIGLAVSALLASIRQVWKDLPGTNARAYLASFVIDEEKNVYKVETRKRALRIFPDLKVSELVFFASPSRTPNSSSPAACRRHGVKLFFVVVIDAAPE